MASPANPSSPIVGFVPGKDLSVAFILLFKVKNLVRDEKKDSRCLKNVMQTVFTLIFQLLHISMSLKVRLEGQVSADTCKWEDNRLEEARALLL